MAALMQSPSRRWSYENVELDRLRSGLLIVAAFVISAGATAAMSEEIVLGIIIAVLAFASSVRPSQALSWCVAIAGLWTVVARAIMRNTQIASRNNDLIVGIIVLVLGFVNAVYRQGSVPTRA